ncbi:MAG: beta-galactosidase [Verrucomicrobia bacterium]|nr:beta-galactosidase [Verrucomicrobiota bacterium]
MLIGTQYYRPPNPEPNEWEADFRQIAALGFSLVRCWIYWRAVEPREGKWIWEDYDRFMDLAEKHGLKVVLQLVPESQPEWFLSRHRDLWPRDASGQAVGQAGTGMVALGGYPGIFYDQPPAAAGIAEFYRAAARRYASHPALYAWDVWNEIQPHFGVFSYDEATIRLWQEFLAGRFGTVEELNRWTLGQFSTFEDVPIVNPSARYPGAVHWKVLLAEFQYWRLARELARRRELVRGVDPDHLIVAHAAFTHVFSSAQNDWQLAAEVDGFGTSQYLTERIHGEGKDYLYAALYYAVTRSLTNGKPWWLSEHSGGPVFYHYGHANKTPAEIRSNLLLPMSHGAAAALFWQYRNERIGEEASSWGLVNFDGSTNSRTDAVQQVTAAIEREEKALEGSVRPASGIGILLDHRSSLLETGTSAWVKQGISAENEANGFYYACVEAGYSPDIFHADQDLSDACRLLILPMRTGLTQEAIAKLLAWVSAGGTLVSTAYLGMFGEDCCVPRILPREPWSSAFGLRVLSRHYPSAPQLIAGAGNLPPLAGHWTVEEIRVDRAEVVGTWDGHPAITRRRHGKGELWYVASCPGQVEDRTSLRAWIRHWADGAGVSRWYEAGPEVFGERQQSPAATFLFLTNAAHADTIVTVIGTAETSGSVSDMLTGEPMGNLTAGERQEFCIPGRETLWLKLLKPRVRK